MSMLDELKSIMQNGERYIVVEGGRPEYVLMRFADYVTLAAGAKGNPGRGASGERSAEWESVNAELEEVRAQEHAPRGAFGIGPHGAPAAADPTIRLEDLPL